MGITIGGSVTLSGNITLSAPGASHWVIGEASGTGDIGYALGGIRTSWTFYDRMSGNSSTIDGAYGKDASGNGIYLFSQSNSSGEVVRSSTDITDGNLWTAINLPDGGQQFCDAVTWSNDSTNSTSGVWMVGRKNGHVYRSTDGAQTFTEITLPNDTGYFILSIAGNGAGKFVTGQRTRLHVSTDDGASFTSSTPFTADVINGVAYTNNTWIVTYSKSGEDNLFARTASDSDLSTWSSEVDLGILAPHGQSGQVNEPNNRACLAAANGRVVIVSNERTGIARLDINGTTTSNLANPTSLSTGIRDIATDGHIWMIVTDDGDIHESTDNGATFTKTVDDVRGTERNLQTVVAAQYLPL